MNPKRNATVMTVLFVAVQCNLSQGQTPAPTTLVIDLQNVVSYLDDVSDPLQLATNPNVTPRTFTGVKSFAIATILGDIVAVNGLPAKGTYVSPLRGIEASPAPSPQGAVADVTRTAVREDIFEILNTDGSAVGTIMSLGFAGGPAPPGTPSAERGNWAIVGGTGAFLGARGQVSGTGQAGRAASAVEDPANRRANGGTAVTMIIHLIPMSAPQIVITAGGPAVVHSGDFSLVTASRPAAAGEVLSLFATDLGPAVGVDTGQPFPLTPPAAVNSPVTVTVNGKPADVLAAVGYPGAVDGYQVNFRIPPDVQKGNAIIQLAAAWVPGAPVSIPVQ
jgi:hypothetical protein